jgi:hypothetical protein
MGVPAVDPPDVDRIAELTRRLEEICRESRRIRAEIAAMALSAPAWPDIEEISRASRVASSPSAFSPPEKTTSDSYLDN